MRVEGEELLQKRMTKIKAGDKLAKRVGLNNKKENNEEKILVDKLAKGLDCHFSLPKQSNVLSPSFMVD